jgi:hypothetical protein
LSTNGQSVREIRDLDNFCRNQIPERKHGRARTARPQPEANDVGARSANASWYARPERTRFEDTPHAPPCSFPVFSLLFSSGKSVQTPNFYGKSLVFLVYLPVFYRKLPCFAKRSMRRSAPNPPQPVRPQARNDTGPSIRPSRRRPARNATRGSPS